MSRKSEAGIDEGRLFVVTNRLGCRGKGYCEPPAGTSLKIRAPMDKGSPKVCIIAQTFITHKISHMCMFLILLPCAPSAWFTHRQFGGTC